MTPFTLIEDSLCITKTKGVSKQVPLYRRDEKLYAQHGSGFIRLHKHGVTSVPHIRWMEFDLSQTNFQLADSRSGYLEIEQKRKRKPIAKAA